jgi:Secretion system C-terminal sorting domain
MKRILFSLLCFIVTIGLSAQPRVYTPSLNSPANNAINQMPNVSIHWNAITGSLNLQYQAQLDTTPAFNSALLVDTTMVLLTGYKGHDLLFNKKYYWRVRAIDNGETSYWSVVWSFTVFNQVELEKPMDNDGGILSPDTTIQWKTTVNKISITGISGYDYQLDTTTQFNSALLIEGSTDAVPVTGKTYKTAKPVNMHFGCKYYWRVRATHGMGHSDYCVPFSFQVVGKFTLTDPVNNSAKVFKDVVLKWEKESGLLAYGYEVATDQNFTDIIEQSEVTVPSIKMTYIRFGSTYYWRVRGRHAEDTSVWSDPWKFTVINTVDLKAPANNELNVSLTPSLTWTTQTGILNYSLQFDDNGTFANPLINVKPGATDTKYPIPAAKKLAPEKTYYWRMRAYADGLLLADTTAWSPTWSFTTGKATGIEDASTTALNIYPNPASSKIFIKLDVKDVSSINFTLIDLVGKEIMKQDIPVSGGLNIKEIQLNNVNKGIYIGRITIGDNIINQKIIVEK